MWVQCELLCVCVCGMCTRAWGVYVCVCVHGMCMCVHGTYSWDLCAWDVHNCMHQTCAWGVRVCTGCACVHGTCMYVCMERIHGICVHGMCTTVCTRRAHGVCACARNAHSCMHFVRAWDVCACTGCTRVRAGGVHIHVQGSVHAAAPQQDVALHSGPRWQLGGGCGAALGRTEPSRRCVGRGWSRAGRAGGARRGAMGVSTPGAIPLASA